MHCHMPLWQLQAGSVVLVPPHVGRGLAPHEALGVTSHFTPALTYDGGGQGSPWHPRSLATQAQALLVQ
jgi:hypothetical protein